MDIQKTLLHLRPGTVWNCGGDFASLEWLDASPKPTLSELEAAWLALSTPPVPREVSARQFRRALLEAGTSPDAITEMLAGDEEALIDWEFATVIRRDYPLVSALAMALGKSSEDVDAIFRRAGEL